MDFHKSKPDGYLEVMINYGALYQTVENINIGKKKIVNI